MIEETFEHECTSWMLFPDITGGHYYLHKNRDAKERGIVVVKSDDDAMGFHWIGLGRKGSICMGINEKGLSIVMNSGEKTFENEPAEGRMGTPTILQLLLETTASAKEASKKYEEIIAEHKYTHEKRGSIFFFQDTNEGYLTENTAHHAISVKVDKGMLVRANIWHNPGMAGYSRNPVTSTMNSISREYLAKTELNKAFDKDGSISLQDIWAVSRMRGDLALYGNDYGVCNITTNSAATLEVDKEFPDVLSTAYVTIGPPAHTLFLPVPICLDSVPADIADASWAAKAFARLERDKLAFDSSVWNAPEKEMLAKYSTALASARVALKNGKRDDAIKIMRGAFNDCYEIARKYALDDMENLLPCRDFSQDTVLKHRATLRRGYSHQVLEDFVGRLRNVRAERLREMGALKTREEALAFQAKIRAAVAESFGPWPEKCALEPVVTGTIQEKGYRIEKVRICSRPGFWVTMNLYVPDGLQGKAPAVIGLMGHSQDGKGCEEYQRFAIRLVSNGFIVLMLDPLQQGERIQYEGFEYVGQANSLCRIHNVIGKQLELFGDSFGSWRVWDAKRALDYLETRCEVDVTRIGVTGNSGGGTTTEWFWANEDRLAFAAPNCHVTTFMCNLENELPTDAEQCPFGVIKAGMEMVDLMICQAPKPVILLGEKYDFFERRGFLEAYKDLRNFYKLLGAEENANMFMGPTYHCYSEYCQPEMVRFFHKTVGMKNELVEFKPETRPVAETFVCDGNVVKTGSRPVYDLMKERADALEKDRKAPVGKEWNPLLKSLLALPELPQEPPHYRCLGATWKDKLVFSRYSVETEREIKAIVYKRGMKSQCYDTLDIEEEIDVYLPNFSSEEDILWNPVMAGIARNGVLYSLDVRGLGESMPDEENDFHTAYGMDFMMHSFSLMFGESDFGRRVFDAMRAIQLFKAEGAKTIRLHGRGQGALIAAYTAMLMPEIASVTLYDAPVSYRQWIDMKLCDWPAANVPRGVLKYFDLPDLYNALDNRLCIKSSWNAFMSRK